MYNFASLIAEQDALRHYKKIFKEIDVDSLTRLEAIRILDAADTIDERNTLLNRKVEIKNYDWLMIFCRAELKIHSYIKREVWVGGSVTYMLGLNKYTVKANTNMLGALTLNKMLLDGYKFEENVGKHFVVTAPNGGMRATTTNQCTCNVKDCVHQIAIKEIVNNRKRCKGLYKING